MINWQRYLRKYFTGSQVSSCSFLCDPLWFVNSCVSSESKGISVVSLKRIGSTQSLESVNCRWHVLGGWILSSNQNDFTVSRAKTPNAKGWDQLKMGVKKPLSVANTHTKKLEKMRVYHNIQPSEKSYACVYHIKTKPFSHSRSLILSLPSLYLTISYDKLWSQPFPEYIYWQKGS